MGQHNEQLPIATERSLRKAPSVATVGNTQVQARNNLLAATLRDDPGTGTLQLTLPDGHTLSLDVAAPEQSGDGTVPFPSGQAPALAGIPCFAQRGYDHQGAYKPEQLAGIQVALYGIVKFAQQRQE